MSTCLGALASLQWASVAAANGTHYTICESVYFFAWYCFHKKTCIHVLRAMWVVCFEEKTLQHCSPKHTDELSLPNSMNIHMYIIHSACVVPLIFISIVFLTYYTVYFIKFTDFLPLYTLFYLEISSERDTPSTRWRRNRILFSIN